MRTPQIHRSGSFRAGVQHASHRRYYTFPQRWCYYRCGQSGYHCWFRSDGKNQIILRAQAFCGQKLPCRSRRRSASAAFHPSFCHSRRIHSLHPSSAPSSGENRSHNRCGFRPRPSCDSRPLQKSQPSHAHAGLLFLLRLPKEAAMPSAEASSLELPDLCKFWLAL